MDSAHFIPKEEFIANPEKFLDLIEANNVRVEINDGEGKSWVLVHPKELRFLDKCVEFARNVSSNERV